MKKFLSILLVLVLCTSIMPLTAFAAENGSMDVTEAKLTAGSSAEITVSLTSNPGVMAYTVKPNVPDGFSIQMVKAGMDGIWTIGQNAQWDNGEDSTYTGPILTVTVTADADVEPGTYAISFSAVGANYDEEDINFGSCTATITVEEPVHEHTWGKWEVTKAPTCTEKGEETRTCACGEKETREVAAKGHTFGEWKVTKAATCTTKGEETRTCACGEKETREIAAKGHTFGEWKVTKAATCTTKGEETRTCACGEKETRAVAMLAHNLEMKYDENNHWTECKDCKFVGEKSAHTFENNGYCECGYKKPVVEKPGDAELDDVPETGDITPMLNMTAVAAVAVVAALAYVLKRKTAK